MLKELVLAILMSNRPFYGDTESWDERQARMEIAADAVVEATDYVNCHEQPAPCKHRWGKTRKEIAMLLLTQLLFESAGSKRVYDNKCLLEKGECDAYRTILLGEDALEKAELQYKNWVLIRLLPDNKDSTKIRGAYVAVQRAYSFWQLHKANDISEEDWSVIAEGGPEATRVAARVAALRLSSAYAGCGTIEGAIGRYARGSLCYAGEPQQRRAQLMYKMMGEPLSEVQRRVERRKKESEAKHD
jgi:hypothetical protein